MLRTKITMELFYCRIYGSLNSARNTVSQAILDSGSPIEIEPLCLHSIWAIWAGTEDWRQTNLWRGFGRQALPKCIFAQQCVLAQWHLCHLCKDKIKVGQSEPRETPLWPLNQHKLSPVTSRRTDINTGIHVYPFCKWVMSKICFVVVFSLFLG